MVRTLVLCIALLVAALPAIGQIRYRLNGSQTNLSPTFDNSVSPPNIEINLGSLGSSTIVHIFDLTADAPALGVGMITLRGSASSTAVVRVVIASRSLSDPSLAFSSPLVSRNEGLRDWGGLRCLHPTDVNDTTLRDRVSLSATTVGTLSGDVAAGCIYRIHVKRRKVHRSAAPFPATSPAPATTKTWNRLSLTTIQP